MNITRLSQLCCSPSLYVIIIQIKLGESCKNNGCKNTYQGEDVDYNNCKHHPGIPVFHEGEMNIEE